MRTAIIFRDNTDYSRTVTDYLRDFYRQTGKQLEVIDPDSREGSGFVTTYDLMEYPSIISLDDDGKLVQVWRGLPLPRIGEVSYYVR